MKQTLHVLHIEDSKEDSELIQHLLLNDGFTCEMMRIETRLQLFDALQNDSFDLILADCKLPQFSGLHALEIAHALKPEIPFVFVSGTIGEETAIESLRNGATDYVLKDRLSRLTPAVRRALAEAEERTLTRQLQHRLREAGRLEAISTLSNGIAHDFNNILTIILGHASLLTSEYHHPERVLEITETIIQAGQRASEIVQQLMAFARKSDGHITPTDLNRSVQDHLGKLKEMVPAHIQLTFKPAMDLPAILADARQMERMLTNLVINAVDSMPQEGWITLSTQLVSNEDLPSLLPESASGKYLCLKITDTGSGMDLTTREHVFEPFYTTKERGHGTGLGLPVVYGLMQVHKGYVDIETELDEGTTVSLFFPVPLSTPAKRLPVLPGTDSSLCGTETILIVEDELDVSFFLQTILQSHGYHVHSAPGYDEALNLFQTHRDEIQMVFSDIGLPRVDGITLCSKLKMLKPGLFIILASGYSPNEFSNRMRELTADAFLSKPYSTSDILQCVRRVLDGSKYCPEPDREISTG